MTTSRKTLLAVTLALIGFAGNSILCRMALFAGAIDAWSFTALRLCSGALVLAVIARIVAGKTPARAEASFVSGLLLFGYAAAFSLAYVRIPTGIGALVLFAAVQVAMIGHGLGRGERLGVGEWTGLALALGGLAVLAFSSSENVSGPNADVLGIALMVSAGIAWGAYSIRGRSSRSPLRTTAGNFAWSVPLALAGLLVGLMQGREHVHVTSRGVWLALASGTLASGIGYSLWYLALPALTSKRAALVQLLVPVIAAIGGIVLLGEHVTARLAIAGTMILCGVTLAIARRNPPRIQARSAALDG